MSKRLTIAILILLILIPQSVFADKISGEVVAIPAHDTIIIDGNKKNVNLYNIEGYNYIKLRDFGALLDNTNNQFNIEWNHLYQSISLKTGESYKWVGGELELDNRQEKLALANVPKVSYDKWRIHLTGYMIDGHNYFELKELAHLLEVDLEWNSKTEEIIVSTELSTPDNGSWIGKYGELYKRLNENTVAVYSFQDGIRYIRFKDDVPLATLELYEDRTFKYTLDFSLVTRSICGDWEIDERDSELIHLLNYDGDINEKISFRRNHINEVRVILDSGFITSYANGVSGTIDNTIYTRVK